MSDSIFNFADASSKNAQKDKTTYLDRMDLNKKELFVKDEIKKEKHDNTNNKDVEKQKKNVEEVGKSSVPSVKKSNFTHLHLHTEYSLLDGACHIKKLPKLLKSMGMEACAITDHGNMFGVIEFYKEMKTNGIKPIIGCEVYVAPPGKTRFDKDGQFYGESDKKYNHLILLAKNQKGYENLMKIVSIGWTEGFYYKPRVDIDILKKYNEGLVCLSACLGGILNQELLYGTYEQAKKYALEYKEIYGDDFYVEIQDHGIREQKINNPKLIQIAKETDLKVVATCDSHYLTKDDYYSHELLLAIQTGATIKDEKRFSFPQNEFYVKSEEEMLEIFSYIPEAIYNTQEIVDKCNFEMKFGDIHLPDYEYPAGFQSETAFFHDLVKKGLKERYGKNLTQEHIERAKYELSVIEKMHFVGYFNIVSDFIRWAKEENIPVGPGRGCTDEDTKILTSIGYKYIKDIKIGDYVYSHKGDLKEVTDTFIYDNDDILLKPRVYFGDSEGDFYTPDHKMFASKKGENSPRWIKAEDLKPGDYVCSPKISIDHTDNTKLSDNFLYICGLISNFGHIIASNDLFICRFNRKNNKKPILSLLVNDLGISPESISHKKLKDVFRISIDLKKVDKKVLDKIKKYTDIDNVLLLPEDYRRKFVSGYFDLCDGDFNRCYVNLANEDKLFKIRKLLSSLNIPNGIKKQNFRSNNYLTLTSRYMVMIPDGCLEGNSALDSDKYFTDENYVYKKIYKIEKRHNVNKVYDITVEDDHSYVTSNFAAHNSAAGSIIAYATHITDVDPIKYGLLFERFLNPERISFPDIDVDFCYDRRHEVIDYVTEKYGKERVSQIVTFGTMAARMAIRDVGRALDIPLYIVDRVAKAVPNELKITIKKALEISKDLQDEYKSSPQIKELIDEAIKIEGSPRHTSKHAAGVVIADDDISKYAPLMTADGEAVVQFPMTELEEIGLIKMDVRIV